MTIKRHGKESLGGIAAYFSQRWSYLSVPGAMLCAGEWSAGHKDYIFTLAIIATAWHFATDLFAMRQPWRCILLVSLLHLICARTYRSQRTSQARGLDREREQVGWIEIERERGRGRGRDRETIADAAQTEQHLFVGVEVCVCVTPFTSTNSNSRPNMQQQNAIKQQQTQRGGTTRARTERYLWKTGQQQYLLFSFVNGNEIKCELYAAGSADGDAHTLAHPHTHNNINSYGICLAAVAIVVAYFCAHSLFFAARELMSVCVCVCVCVFLLFFLWLHFHLIRYCFAMLTTFLNMFSTQQKFFIYF